MRWWHSTGLSEGLYVISIILVVGNLTVCKTIVLSTERTPEMLLYQYPQLHIPMLTCESPSSDITVYLASM